MSDEKPTHAYQIRERCGCVQTVTVDNPNHSREVARELAKGIRRGATVERVLLADAQMDWECPHKAPKSKPDQSVLAL